MTDEEIFPLEMMDDFEVKAAPLVLPVSSIVLETRPEMMGKIRMAIEWHRKWFRFAREVVVACEDPCIPGVSFVRCAKPPDGNADVWYSDYCVRFLNQICDAPFALVWQWDGFVCNPELWRNEFLAYDYVGAPVVADFWWAGGKYVEMHKPGWKSPVVDRGVPIVGNGGFSLRSKRFLQASAALSVPQYASTIRNEDVFLCVERREELERPQYQKEVVKTVLADRPSYNVPGRASGKQ